MKDQSLGNLYIEITADLTNFEKQMVAETAKMNLLGTTLGQSFQLQVASSLALTVQNLQLTIQQGSQTLALLLTDAFGKMQLSTFALYGQVVLTTNMLQITWNTAVENMTAKTVASVTKMINYYQQLAAAIRTVNTLMGGGTATKTLSKSYAVGGYTGGTSPLAEAGTVHEGEYVIPKWIVDTQTSLVQSLESLRTGQSNKTISQDNRKTLNIELGSITNLQNIDPNLWLEHLAWRLGYL